MRVIGIPVADRDECALALDAAFELGKILDAGVAGYHMVADKPAWEDRFDMAGVWAGGQLLPAPWPDDDEKARRKMADKARDLFQAKAEAAGFQCTSNIGSSKPGQAVYSEISGTPDQAVPAFGPTNDMLVVSRPTPRGGMKAWVVMLSALLDSTTPVLIMPQKKHTLKTDRIAIAWNNGATEALLVRSAVPMLKQAKEVTFITANGESRHGPRAKDMINYLKAHGIKASQKKVKGKSAASAIETAVDELDAGLLLSGGYTRGRMRELVMGGVTENLVTKTRLPVLMLHK